MKDVRKLLLIRNSVACAKQINILLNKITIKLHDEQHYCIERNDTELTQQELLKSEIKPLNSRDYMISGNSVITIVFNLGPFPPHGHGCTVHAEEEASAWERAAGLAAAAAVGRRRRRALLEGGSYGGSAFAS